jgi:hypothetical protein
MANNPIPPRSRAYCYADSPRRGEYGALTEQTTEQQMSGKIGVNKLLAF